MNIEEIKSSIEELEKDDLTLSNVRNLASLYIIYNNLEKSVRSQIEASESILNNKNSIENELNDILPAYTRYKNVKIQYQLHQLPDDALVPAMKLLVQELEEFILILYNNTHLRKERICIESMVTKLHDKFMKN